MKPEFEALLQKLAEPIGEYFVKHYDDDDKLAVIREVEEQCKTLIFDKLLQTEQRELFANLACKAIVTDVLNAMERKSPEEGFVQSMIHKIERETVLAQPAISPEDPIKIKLVKISLSAIDAARAEAIRPGPDDDSLSKVIESHLQAGLALLSPGERDEALLGMTRGKVMQAMKHANEHFRETAEPVPSYLAPSSDQGGCDQKAPPPS